MPKPKTGDKIYVIGVDIGGTYVRAGLSDGKTILEKLKEEIDKRSVKSLQEQPVKMSRLLCKAHGTEMKNIDGICIASLGPIDFKRGELINPINVPFKRVPLVKPVKTKLRVPVHLINDCVAGVIGEHEFGAGKGLDNLVYITIGTGIGAGVFVDGRVLLGKDGNAHEVGHITVDHTGALKCGHGCEKGGHWEAYCSGANIPNFVRMRLKSLGKKARGSLLYKLAGEDLSNLSAETLFRAARAGDDEAIQIIEEMGKLNAIGFANVVNAYDPSLITVGGSVALKNKRYIIDPILKNIKNHVCNRLPKIMSTPLGEDAELWGAIATLSRRALFRSFIKRLSTISAFPYY